ncbi:hypothetical protein GCM10023115_28040 [Pontixanthobacter gangjinensis]|uniref:Uncharacterized protein n=1 Tax=Christiangramia aestuarii TaxID=1028746 RepID=A0A7K1LMM4_9FLAO|nr:hypothetical protein [Christiangramia aestuarii]MUP42037.1 hypothetical protein [Christiangramia aestuarii]
METQPNNAVEFREGMMVSELRQNTSISFINTLREKELIVLNHRGEVRLTQKGKIASKLGVKNYLRLEETERQFFDDEIQNMKIENRGLVMIFGGMFISLILIIGFWALELKGF